LKSIRSTACTRTFRSKTLLLLDDTLRSIQGVTNFRVSKNGSTPKPCITVEGGKAAGRTQMRTTIFEARACVPRSEFTAVTSVHRSPLFHWRSAFVVLEQLFLTPAAVPFIRSLSPLRVRAPRIWRSVGFISSEGTRDEGQAGVTGHTRDATRPERSGHSTLAGLAPRTFGYRTRHRPLRWLRPCRIRHY
jgi:hypothetical protein